MYPYKKQHKLFPATDGSLLKEAPPSQRSGLLADQPVHDANRNRALQISMYLVRCGVNDPQDSCCKAYPLYKTRVHKQRIQTSYRSSLPMKTGTWFANARVAFKCTSDG